LWRESFIKRTWCVGVEVILDQSNVFCHRIMLDQLFHKLGIILLRSALLDLDNPFACKRFEGNEYTAGPVPAVFVIFPFWTARFHRDGRYSIAYQLARPFIETDYRISRIIRLLIEVQHILHVPDEIACNLSYAPLLLLPRLDFVFFSAL
jgi:hypothetical protein